MFTVKFYRADNHVSISCPVYEVQGRDDGYTVTVYKSPVLVDGVEYQIAPTERGDSPNKYDGCYVENEAGKTIASHHAPVQLVEG